MPLSGHASKLVPVGCVAVMYVVQIPLVEPLSDHAIKLVPVGCLAAVYVV